MGTSIAGHAALPDAFAATGALQPVVDGAVKADTPEFAPESRWPPRYINWIPPSSRASSASSHLPGST
ncbi:MAG TPA: hypothetical protein VEB69_08850 [Acidimicrobiia bacterium]|nr:hypothetical protein [Acidimicrobiia bacterium]